MAEKTINITAQTKEGTFERVYKEVRDEYGMFELTPENLISEVEIFPKSEIDLLKERLNILESELNS